MDIEYDVYLGVYGSKFERGLSILFNLCCRKMGKIYYPQCSE